MTLQNEEMLERLRGVGLSRYEASVYLGLVTDQKAKVTEISKRTGVPQPKVYQAMDSLVEKGFCALGSDLVNRYRPIPPEQAFESRLGLLERQRQETIRLADDLKQLLAEGEGQGLWAPPVEIVKGLGQVVSFLSDRVSEAKTSVDYFGKLPQVPAPNLRDAIQERAQAGVKVRSLLERGYLESTDAAEGESEGFKTAGEYHIVDYVPSKMAIVDGSTALLSISRPGAETFLMIVFRHRGLVEHFVASFEHHWAAAQREQ